MNVWRVNATIPAAVPSGEVSHPLAFCFLPPHSDLWFPQYLLRMEHIALNQGINQTETQYYVSCAQIKVVGGGNGAPSPLVAIPGHFQADGDFPVVVTLTNR